MQRMTAGDTVPSSRVMMQLSDFVTSSWNLKAMRMSLLQQSMLKGSPVPSPVCDQPDSDRWRVVYYPVSDVVDPDLDLAAASGVIH